MSGISGKYPLKIKLILHFPRTFAPRFIWLLWLLPVLSGMLHARIFGLELMGVHVWRQTQTETVTRNFYKEDGNIFRPKNNHDAHTDRIQRMEFPLMQWGFAGAHYVLGPQIWVSRALSFLIGLLSVWGMYFLLRALFKNPREAIIGAWAFHFSPVVYYYVVNPLPDNLALCAGIWSAGWFFRGVQSEGRSPAWWFSAFFLGIAVLCKLPFVLFGVLPVVWAAQSIFSKKASRALAPLGIYALALLPGLLWYAWAIQSWGSNGIVRGILDNKLSASEILDILQAHLISILPETLLNYAALPLFLAAFYFCVKKKSYLNPYFPLLAAWGIATLGYFFFELNMILKVHDYYLFPFLPLLFIMVAFGAKNLWELGGFSRYLVVCCVLVMPLTAFLRMNSRWKPGPPLDLFAHRAAIKAIGSETDRWVVGRDVSRFIFLYYIDKKGWAFSEDNFTPANFALWRANGARFFLCDDRSDTLHWVKPHLQEPSANFGQIRVFGIVPE